MNDCIDQQIAIVFVHAKKKKKNYASRMNEAKAKRELEKKRKEENCER